MTEKQIGDNTGMQINLRWFIQIMVAVAIAVWGYFALTERITFLEHQQGMSQIQQEMNSEFRIKWPRGELGALPDDAEQNMRLDMAERIIEKMEMKIEIMNEQLQELRHTQRRYDNGR
jgi:hypothetical protein